MVSLLGSAAIPILPALDGASPAAAARRAGSVSSVPSTRAGPLVLRAIIASRSVEVCVIPGSVRGASVGAECLTNWLMTGELLLFRNGDPPSLFATRPIASWLGFMLHKAQRCGSQIAHM